MDGSLMILCDQVHEVLCWETNSNPCPLFWATNRYDFPTTH